MSFYNINALEVHILFAAFAVYSLWGGIDLGLVHINNNKSRTKLNGEALTLFFLKKKCQS